MLESSLAVTPIRLLRSASSLVVYQILKMSSGSTQPSNEVGCPSHESVVPATTNLTECQESLGEAEEDEDEEEDIDFNPFLKEALSPDASSSLSSEAEVLDANVVGGEESNCEPVGLGPVHLTGDAQKFADGDNENDEEETVMQTTVSPRGQCQNELEKALSDRPNKRIPIPSCLKEIGITGEKENGSSSEIDINHATVREANNTTPRKPTVDLDDDDAICMRTRARYSLASFTMDELETFLQETDDDDDLQNVDDEEEYRKFLAAVLLGGESDGQPTQEVENVDDEDEDNDADFEIELEEALESDPDESAKNKAPIEERERGGRRPETRQNKRQKTSSQFRKNLLEQSKRPLRPLLPIMPNVSMVPFFTHDGKTLMPENTPCYQSSRAEDAHVNGFTPNQIGELYCLIHEHVQLLIQVFSLCVLDHSRQHIASQVEGLVQELLHKRDEVVSRRNVPYSDLFFRPPYICQSSVAKLPTVYPAQCTSFDPQGVCSPSNNQMPGSRNLNRQVGTCQDAEKSSWMPRVSSPIISILDTAPLNLVGKYIDDVYTALREYRQRNVETVSDVQPEREPMFPLPNFPSSGEVNCEISRVAPPSANLVLPSSSQQQPKKTLAATIVESTMKQSVALVPKEIAKLAQRFFPLFNSALFPHKPPSVAVANRVLFTDSEDELLALGLMEFNTDWKAIQQRFLPCKDEHQIFVRKKNRCSSKAPENPIKAVRRMKTSPLTSEELERIHEGLKFFKQDWMSVWKFIVPHRDPSLLPRQWRIAIGTQKSYKTDSAKKEKRRLYELKRRRSKTANLANWQIESGKEDCPAEFNGENSGGDDYAETADEAFVHEAFLADWRPATYNHISSQDSAHAKDTESHMGNMQQFAPAVKGSQQSQMTSPFSILPNHPVSGANLNISRPQIILRPSRVRKANSARLVKLAPGLPPVNLPPSVRVISQSAFQNYQRGPSIKPSSTAVSGTGDVGRQNAVAQLPYVSMLGMSPVKAKKDSVKSSSVEESDIVKEKSSVEPRGTDADLHMHPLLFKASEDGCSPCFPQNCSSNASSSFSFFSGNKTQLNLSLFHHQQQQASYGVDGSNKSMRSKESTLSSSGIDFHPLLQRNDNLSGDRAQLRNPFAAVQAGSQVNNRGTGPSSPNERANELDLEIYLSSTSRKEKAAESNDVASSNPMKSTIPAIDPGATMETRNTSTYYHQGENGPAVSNKLASSATHLLVEPRNSIYIMDDIGEQSHPEIVMEQEELSDSEEEIEEHVEFECEEMADSEGEESCSDEAAELQNKEAITFARETIESDVDSDDQQENVLSPRKADTPSSGREKHSTNRSWLTLDSCAPGASPNMNPKTEDIAAKSSAISRPSRSCKKPAAQNHVPDLAEQLNLGSLAIQRLKKPRKRVCKTNPNLNMGLTIRSSPPDGTDKLD